VRRVDRGQILRAVPEAPSIDGVRRELGRHGAAQDRSAPEAEERDAEDRPEERHEAQELHHRQHEQEETD